MASSKAFSRWDGGMSLSILSAQVASLRGERAICVLPKSLIISELYLYWPLLGPLRTISDHFAKPAPGIHRAARVLPRTATIPFRESSRRRAFTSPRSIDSDSHLSI